jgi:hypothetical protein
MTADSKTCECYSPSRKGRGDVGGYNPSVFARMLRWISLVPP